MQHHYSARAPKNRAALVLAIAGAALAALSSCASRASKTLVPPSRGQYAEAVAACDDKIKEEMARLRIAGLSVVVADAEGTIWAKGYQRSDKSGKPFSPTTVSNAGSVSKLFTATAVMRLVEEGKLDLDAPLSRYLPDFKPLSRGPDPDGVTLRSLLCHESGLQSDILRDFETENGFASQENPRPYADNAKLASGTTLCWEPYTVFSYSNLGFSLLGLAVEEASGMSFADYVDKEILAPAGMASSSFAYRPALAERYAKGPLGAKWVGIPAIRDMPAGSFCTTAEDMGRFLAAVLRSKAGKGRAEGGILEPASLEEMWTRQNGKAARDLDFEVGLGWWKMKTDFLPGATLYGHGGDLAPFHALLLIDPEAGIGAYVMVNSADGLGSFSLGDIGAAVLRAFASSQKGVRYPDSPEKPRVVPMPAEVAKRLEGSWTSMEGLLRFERKGKGMKANAFGIDLDADYLSDGTVGLSARILGIKLPILTLDQMGVTLEEVEGRDCLGLRAAGIAMGICERAEKSELDPAWSARKGTWVPVAKDEASDLTIGKASFGVDKASGLNVVTVSMAGQNLAFPVASRNADELYLCGYGRNLGSTIRAYRVDGEERIETFGIEFKRKK